MQTSVAFLKTLVLACLIVRSGTMIGQTATARGSTTVGVVETTIALSQNQLAVKPVMLFLQLVSISVVC